MQACPAPQQAAPHTTPVGQSTTHWPVEKSHVCPAAHVPHELPQASVPHTLLPHSQVTHAPLRHCWFAVQQALPQGVAQPATQVPPTQV
jgi:hypothetical protein